VRIQTFPCRSRPFIFTSTRRIGAKEETNMAAFTFMRARVESFEKFQTTFAAGDEMRRSAGMRATTVARDAQDPSVVVVQSRWDDVASAKRFLASDRMREAMKTAGVQSPELHFLEIAYEASY
jgi:heme-degrading monooxygenase HmoA